MAQQIFSVSTEEPTISIKTHSNLTLIGWEQKEVNVKGGSRYTLNIRQDGDNITITSSEDCLVMAPFRSKVIIERVGGDAYISDLQNDLVCQKINGDLHLFKIGRIAVEQVGGDCEVLHVEGDVESRKIGGDFIGKIVSGHALIERVGGDFFLQNANCPVTCRAGGDIHISLSERPTGSSNLTAGGDVTIHMPEDSGVSLDIFSGGEDIRINLGSRIEDIEEHNYSATIGDGSAIFTLRAGGDVEVTSQPWVEDLLKDIQEEMGYHTQVFESTYEDRFEDVARQVASDAASRAEKKVQAALRRIEHRGYFPDHPSGHSYSATFNADFPFKKPEPPSPVKPMKPVAPVSDEERLMILKMVEAKKISIDEAERLLEALEGK